MDVMVTGATGFVGRALVPALVSAGHRVTALTRDAAEYDPPAGVRVVEGDLLEPASLTGAFERIDVAYYLVHSLGAGPSFAERDRGAARAFARAASAADVERVVYLGGLGETGEGLSEHLRSRREVEAVLADGAYALTTLRAAIIVGDGSASFTMVRQLADRLPVMVTPGWVRTECQPIAIEDVVAYLVGVLDATETVGETYEIGGPEVLTYGAVLRRTARHLGRRPLIVPVPVLSPELSVYWVDLVTDVPRSVAHPLVHGLRNPVVVADDRILDVVPVDPTPFDEAVEAALGPPVTAGGGWAYLRIVAALPGPLADARIAIAAQFLGFAAVAVGLAARYDAWGALPLATTAIGVSTLGSGVMAALRRRIGALDPPTDYRRLLFESGADVVMGLVGFVAVATYLLVGARGPGAGPLDRLLGTTLPPPAVFFALLVGWDLAYRVGVGWWTSLTGLWRAVALGDRLDLDARRGYARTDLLAIGFAGSQLLLLPFLWSDPVLRWLLVGHVAAVVVVSGLAILLGRGHPPRRGGARVSDDGL